MIVIQGCLGFPVVIRGHQWMPLCPPKAEVTSSNLVGRAKNRRLPPHLPNVRRNRASDREACAQAIDGTAQSPVTAIASVALRVMRIFMCPPTRSGGFELLGQRELKHLTEWNDGQPGTELNFKLYRQATDKI